MPGKPCPKGSQANEKTTTTTKALHQEHDCIRPAYLHPTRRRVITGASRRHGPAPFSNHSLPTIICRLGGDVASTAVTFYAL